MSGLISMRQRNTSKMIVFTYLPEEYLLHAFLTLVLVHLQYFHIPSYKFFFQFKHVLTLFREKNRPAKMKPKSPHGLPGWESNQFSVLFDDSIGRGSGQEIKVQDATNHPILNDRHIG